MRASGVTMFVMLGLFFACLVVAAGEDEAAVKKDLKKLEGTWALVSGTRDGKQLSEAEVKQTKITFEGNKFIFPSASGIGTSQKGMIEVFPSKNPKWMDSTATTDTAKGEISLGIYEFVGDEYKVCFAPLGKDRPKEFASTPGSGHNLQVWRRAKD